MTAVEVAWTLLCAETQANILLYYAGLVAASTVFFLPWLADGGTRMPVRRGPTSETKG